MRLFKLPLIFFLALTLALTECGCGAKTAPASSASVSSAESSASEKPLNLVAGNSLEMLGYEINIPNDIILSNNLPLYKYSNVMFNHYGIINYDDLLGGEKKYTLVCAVLAIPRTYTGERRTFMCLQAFASADVSTENAVKIGEETYPFEALKPFLIFENDDIVVYDVYSIIDGESLQDQIEAAVTQFNEAVKKTMSLPDGSKMLRGEPRPTEADLVNASDFDYLLEVEEYYRTNLKAMIVKQAPLTSQMSSKIQEQSRAEYVKPQPQEGAPKKPEEDVTLIKSNSVPTGDFTENKYKKSALSEKLLTNVPSNGQLISLTDEPYAEAFAPVASKAEELLTGSHVFIRYLYVIDKNGAPVQNIVCFTPYQWKIASEKNTEHWVSATSLSSGITPMNFPKNGKQNAATELVLVNMDAVGEPLTLTVTVNLSKLNDQNAQVVVWNQETPHDSAAKHSDVLEITVKKTDGTPAVDFEVNLNEFSANEYSALHVPRFTDASGKARFVLSKAIDPGFLKIPNAQTVIRIYDSWYFGDSRNYLHDLYNDDELIKSRELVFPPAVEDLIEFEENPWNNPD